MLQHARCGSSSAPVSWVCGAESAVRVVTQRLGTNPRAEASAKKATQNRAARRTQDGYVLTRLEVAPV